MLSLINIFFNSFLFALGVIILGFIIFSKKISIENTTDNALVCVIPFIVGLVSIYAEAFYLAGFLISFSIILLSVMLLTKDKKGLKK